MTIQNPITEISHLVIVFRIVFWAETAFFLLLFFSLHSVFVIFVDRTVRKWCFISEHVSSHLNNIIISNFITSGMWIHLHWSQKETTKKNRVSNFWHFYDQHTEFSQKQVISYMISKIVKISCAVICIKENNFFYILNITSFTVKMT
jgi:hypothetical protein